ncbi:MAG: GIY-YIG nuclease family protein [Chitinophagales bacterium]|nr:GIY-YIG nuclease family protein [Chitinophagales bacterium]
MAAFSIMAYWCYILYSTTCDRYYVGSCTDLETRLGQHNSGRNKSTKGGEPWELKYQETFADRPSAVRRELEIKSKKSRRYIEYLISSAG